MCCWSVASLNPASCKLLSQCYQTITTDLLPKRQTRSCQPGAERGLMMPNKTKHHSVNPSVLFKPPPRTTGDGNLHEDLGYQLVPFATGPSCQHRDTWRGAASPGTQLGQTDPNASPSSLSPRFPSKLLSWGGGSSRVSDVGMLPQSKPLRDQTHGSALHVSNGSRKSNSLPEH